MKRTLIKNLFSFLLIISMTFLLVACGNSSKGEEPPKEEVATEEAEEVEEAEPAEEIPSEPGTLAVSLGAEPETLDPALNATVDGSSLIVHLFSGLAKWAKDESGNLTIVPDCATELSKGKENMDGTVTYTYKLKDGLKWSDGKDLTAKDFEYAWKRAGNVATGGSYYYMFEAIDGYDEEDPSAELNVKAVDDKTLEVVLANAVNYWDELLAFPTFFPVREDVVNNAEWSKDPSTLISNGLYKMTGWEHGSLITMEKNTENKDSEALALNKIYFNLTDDANVMLENYRSGAWKMIDDVPTNEIDNLKGEYADEFVVAGQMSTYFLCWNVNEELLPGDSGLTGAEAEAAREEIRKALGLLFDRNYIVKEIGQAGQVPASSLVAMGMTDTDGNEFYQNANKAAGNSYIGYYDVSADKFDANYNEAIETLKKYYNFDDKNGVFTNIPKITYLYNTSRGHKAIGEYIQSMMAKVGVPMIVAELEWEDFLATRRDGNFTLCRHGWFADYNDPTCFLEMWTTASGNNYARLGNDANKDLKLYSIDLTDLGYEEKVDNGTWTETYDLLIYKIKKESNKEKRYALMHKAEDLLMSTGCICPVFYYTDVYMIDESVDGFFTNPLGYKHFMYVK